MTESVRLSDVKEHRASFDSFAFKYPPTLQMASRLSKELALRFTPPIIHHLLTPRGRTLFHIRLSRVIPQGHCCRRGSLRLRVRLCRPLISSSHLRLPTPRFTQARKIATHHADSCADWQQMDTQEQLRTDAVRCALFITFLAPERQSPSIQDSSKP